MTLCDRGEGGGSAERYVTPKIIYMYNIYYSFHCYVFSFEYIFRLYMYYYYKQVYILHM